MPSSFTNIHLRTDDAAAVRAALDAAEITQTKMFGRAGTDWVSIYPSATEDGDFDLLKAFAFSLSKHAEILALAVMVQDSLNLRFALYDNGRLLDEYALFPDYPDREGSPKCAGVEALMPYTIEGTSKKDLEILLRPSKKEKVERDAETLAQGLAYFLLACRAHKSAWASITLSKLRLGDNANWVKGDFALPQSTADFLPALKLDTST